MNREILNSTIRHILTLGSGAALGSDIQSLETALPDLIQKISSGDITTIISTVLVTITMAWSYWVKIKSTNKKKYQIDKKEVLATT